MPKLTQPQDVPTELHPVFEFSSPDMQLDLSSDVWNLDPEKQMPRIVGRDVLTPNTLGPERGRKPVTQSSYLSGGSLPIVAAEPCHMYGYQAIRYADYKGSPVITYTGTAVSLVTSSPPWPTEMLNAYIIKNEDGRNGEPEYAVITSISGLGNNQLNFSPPFQNAWDAEDKFTIVYFKRYDKRGIWLMNGRNFYLLQDGVRTSYLDLWPLTGTGVWRAAQIAADRMMFVNANHPPRILSLSSGSTLPDYADSIRKLAGLLPPGAPVLEDPINPGNADRGMYGEFTGYASGSDAVMTPSTLTRVKIRAVNLETFTVSEFVDVRNADAGAIDPAPFVGRTYINDRVNFQIGFAFSDGVCLSADSTDFSSRMIQLMGYQYATGDVLVIETPESHAGEYPITAGSTGLTVETGNYPQYTYADDHHVTITGATWPSNITNAQGYIKCRGDGLVRGRLHLYHDSRRFLVPYDPKWTHIEVWRTKSDGADFFLERRISIVAQEDPLATTDATIITGSNAVVRAPGEMSDERLNGQDILLNAQLDGGGLPPACRFVASLGGCTICGGAGTPMPGYDVDVKAYYFDTATVTGAGTTRTLTKAGIFTDYELQTGDELWLTSGDLSSPAAGVYTITARPTDNTIEFTTQNGAVNPGAGTTYGYIVRAMRYPWPTVRSDEEVYHSRADTFAPESFMDRPVRLSSVGDTMMGLASVGDYVAAIMKSGVHLLRNDAGVIRRETVATSGAGTPWENSIVVHEDNVIWAHPDGPKIMQVFAEPNDVGKRAQIKYLDPEHRVRSWFDEAFRIGYTVDAGIDSLNQCLRFRRSDGSNLFDVLQYSWKLGLWTELEGDNGIRYIRARAVQDDADDNERLYSVTKEGSVFEVNNPSTAWPYAGTTVNGTIGSGGYTGNTTSITKNGAFLELMVGDMIRFRSSTAARNVWRVIRTASINTITFDTVTGLTTGDEFLIAPVRFLLRTAPLVSGPVKDQTKSIFDVRIRAIPGFRTAGSATPGKTLTIRSYRNFGTALEQSVSDITIYHDEVDVAYKDADRVSSIGGQGSSIQLEVEHLENRSDFKIASAAVVTREETNLLADQSASV